MGDGAANSACSNAKATDNAPSHNKAMWIFTEEELQNSPSRKCGIAVEAENLHRKKAAKYIRTIGQRLNLRQHVEISTAIVFFYRFFLRGNPSVNTGITLLHLRVFFSQQRWKAV